MAKWDELVQEVHASEAARVVMSSETFALCDDRAADRVVEAFGADRLHIAITIRPLADMLPSAWQQYVRARMRRGYEDWLRAVLVEDLDGKRTTPSFWARMRLDRIAERWGSRLGYDRVTVVSLAEQEREFVLRVFEAMVGLPEGTLVPGPYAANFSLPWSVAETVRRFNMQFKDQEGGGVAEHARIQLGAVDYLKRQGPTVFAEEAIGTPQWALDRSAELVGDINARLRELGVHVVGDLDALARGHRAAVTTPPPSSVSVEDAGLLMFALVQAATEEGRRQGRREARREALSSQAAAPAPEVGGREALRILSTRARKRLHLS
jgi:hypothetical protein